MGGSLRDTTAYMQAFQSGSLWWSDKDMIPHWLPTKFGGSFQYAKIYKRSGEKSDLQKV